MIFRKFATGSNISCFLLLLLVGCSGKGIAQQSFQINHISFGKAHLEDAQNRIFMAREGLIMTIRPLPIETLNHKPGGKAATIRQLVNHLAFFEVWMVERIRRVKAGEPDFARDKAEQMLPDIGSIKASEFLSHGHFRDGDPTVDSEGLIKRLEKVRVESHKVLYTLSPEDLYLPIKEPVEKRDTNILDLMNHMIFHEYLHIGSMLTIRGMLKKKE